NADRSDLARLRRQRARVDRQRARPPLDAEKARQIADAAEAGVNQHQAASLLVTQHGATAFRGDHAPQRRPREQVPVHERRQMSAQMVAPAPRRMTARMSATTARMSSTWIHAPSV